MARQDQLGQTTRLCSSMQQCHGPLQRGRSSCPMRPTCWHLVPQNTSSPLYQQTEDFGTQRQQPQLLNCGGRGGIWAVMLSNVSRWSFGLWHPWGRCHSVTCAGSSGAAWRALRQGSKSQSKRVSNPAARRVTAESRGKCRGLLAPSDVLAPLTMLNGLIMQAC